MSATDPETYLRLLSERELLDREPSRESEDPVPTVAATLLAAGAIDRDTARRVLADDELALELRGDGFHPHRPGLGRPPRRRPLESRMAAALGQTIDVQDGSVTLHEILIGRTRSTIRYTWVRGGGNPGGSGRLTRRRGGPHGPAVWGSASLSIVDAAGNRPTVRSGGGGGSSDRWVGELILQGRVDPATPWLELDGTRLQLDRATALLSVEIEPLEQSSALERHLWRMLASAQGPFGRQADPGPSLDALAALGLLSADDPLATAVRAVAQAMPEHWHHVHMGSQSARSARRLPEPWRSLLARRGRTDGTDRSLFVAATTPPFDEIQVAVHTVTTDDSGFEAFIEVTPNLLGAAPLGVPPIAWWARDDRGNHYLGGPSGWSGGEGHAEGTIRYWPALDRKATRLELLPSATDHRAVIAIALTDRSDPA